MMNVADNLQDNKKNNELIRRNARGRLGLTSNDISPIGSVNL